MKKLTKRLKHLRRNKTEEAKPIGRITNETVAEHRERILAGGRRFKYPLQYARNRLIRNTIFITLLSILLLSALTWWQLYQAQTTNSFFYRITQILPLPVAKVDNTPAPYSYYLLTLRSSMNYLASSKNVDFSTTDGKRQLSYLKRTSLDDTIKYTYALQLAKAHHITVSDKEVNRFIDTIRRQNKVSVNQAAFEASIFKFYGWSYDEFRDSTRAKLLLNKVTGEIDAPARTKATQVLAQLKGGADFATTAKQVSDDIGVQQSGGDQGAVAIISQDANGLVETAAKLAPGQLSDLIAGSDGLYIIKLLDKNDQTVHFARIFIAYEAFALQLDELKKSKKVDEYISVSKNLTPVQN